MNVYVGNIFFIFYFMEMLILVIVVICLYIYYANNKEDDVEKLYNMTNMFENNKLRNNIKQKISLYVKCLEDCNMDIANSLRYEIMDMARSYIFTSKHINLPIKSFQVQLYKLFFTKCKHYEVQRYKYANEFDNRTSWNQ